MTRADLDDELSRAATNDAVVAALARYFEPHGLAFGHGTDNASDEAFWLLRHLQDWREEAWAAAPDPRLNLRLAELAERRVRERKPLAYLINEAWFAGFKLYVDERVEAGFEPWCRLEPGDRVLDIGTGSGCIAIACALHCPGVVVDATDVSAAALDVAAHNVARYGLEPRVTLHEADLFPPAGEPYRLVVSNPPYVPGPELGALAPEYGHEPALALDGGRTGVELPLELMRGAAERLTEDGVLVLEVGAWADALVARCAGLELIAVELERGGEGVLTVRASELRAYFDGVTS